MSVMVLIFGVVLFLVGRWLVGIGWSFTGSSASAFTVGGHTTFYEGYSGAGGFFGWVIGTLLKLLGTPFFFYGIACVIWAVYGLLTQSDVGLPFWDNIVEGWNKATNSNRGLYSLSDTGSVIINEPTTYGTRAPD